MSSSNWHGSAFIPASTHCQQPPAGLLESHHFIVQHSHPSSRLSGAPNVTDAFRFINQAAQLNTQVGIGTVATKRLVATSPVSKRFQNVPGGSVLARSEPTTSPSAAPVPAKFSAARQSAPQSHIRVNSDRELDQNAAGRPLADWENPRGNAVTYTAYQPALDNNARPP